MPILTSTDTNPRKSLALRNGFAIWHRLLLDKPFVQHFPSLASAGIRLAVVLASVAARMRAQDLARVLDGAGTLFDARHDLGHVAHQPIAMSAIGAVEFFAEIEVSEVVAVEHPVIAAA